MKISEPVIISGEAVIFLEVRPGEVLRIAFGADHRLGHNAIVGTALAQHAVMKARAFFDAIDGAQLTWHGVPGGPESDPTAAA